MATISFKSLPVLKKLITANCPIMKRIADKNRRPCRCSMRITRPKPCSRNNSALTKSLLDTKISIGPEMCNPVSSIQARPLSTLVFKPSSSPWWKNTRYLTRASDPKTVNTAVAHISYIPGNFIDASRRAKLGFPICLNIFLICAYCRSKLLTSCTVVPDPRAIRFRRLPLIDS
jgi:hypothetical protein